MTSSLSHRHHWFRQMLDETLRLKKNANKHWGDVYSSTDSTEQETACSLVMSSERLLGKQCGKCWCSLGFCLYFTIGIHRRPKNEQPFLTNNELKTCRWYCKISFVHGFSGIFHWIRKTGYLVFLFWFFFLTWEFNGNLKFTDKASYSDTD